MLRPHAPQILVFSLIISYSGWAYFCIIYHADLVDWMLGSFMALIVSSVVYFGGCVIFGRLDEWHSGGDFIPPD